ncbi:MULTISPECIES: hypothetical protein [Nostoc]|uniref:Uncharacterized protein n=1 Tax=Nostoc paludosum FACHB-159 TaxID=2692908 RepID=A0ABR8KJ73_9NOSO|nr:MULTISPECIES: hypothetical protein [Nostoc]MBD2738851.1 hypothetical protein [Nostoc paludosum FACHB-159]
MGQAASVGGVGGVGGYGRNLSPPHSLISPVPNPQSHSIKFCFFIYQ